MAVTVGNSGAEVYEISAGGVASVEFTPGWSPTGAAKCLVVGVSSVNGTAGYITGVTRNSGGETFVEALDVIYQPAGYEPNVGIYYFLNPGSSGSIIVTFPGSREGIGIGVANLNGVDAVTPADTATSQTGQNSPASITHAADADDLLICVLAAQDMTTGTITVGADQAVVMSFSYTESAAGWTHAMSTQPGTANDVLSYTFPESGDYWLMGAVAFKPYVDPDHYGTPRDHSGVKPYSSLWRPARA